MSVPESEQETRQWKIQPSDPLADTSDIDMETRPTKKIKPRRRERIFSREEWQVLVIIWGGAGLISVAGGFVGTVLGNMW